MHSGIGAQETTVVVSRSPSLAAAARFVTVTESSHHPRPSSRTSTLTQERERHTVSTRTVPASQIFRLDEEDSDESTDEAFHRKRTLVKTCDSCAVCPWLEATDHATVDRDVFRFLKPVERSETTKHCCNVCLANGSHSTRNWQKHSCILLHDLCDENR